MKVFVSQPMSGLTNEEINENRIKSMEVLQFLNPDIIIEYDPASLYVEEDPEMEKSLSVDDLDITKNRISIFYFLRSVQHMIDKDAIVFLDGWQDSRGCILEYFIAKAFGLTILGEFVNKLEFKSVIGYKDMQTILMNLFKYLK
jgi:hypothetical protein